VDDKTVRALEEELTELRVILARKRSEVSNLKTGYIRAVEGVGPIPPEPLRRNLIATRAELTEIEQRIAAIQLELGTISSLTP
jgi:predicted  nucleic acid-binding Zn-ribbon protein